MVRASTPPEATRARGWAGSPGLAASKNTTSSPARSGPTATSNRAPAIALDSARRSPTEAASAGAAWRRAGARGLLLRKRAAVGRSGALRRGARLRRPPPRGHRGEHGPRRRRNGPRPASARTCGGGRRGVCGAAGPPPGVRGLLEFLCAPAGGRSRRRPTRGCAVESAGPRRKVLVEREGADEPRPSRSDGAPGESSPPEEAEGERGGSSRMAARSASRPLLRPAGPRPLCRRRGPPSRSRRPGGAARPASASLALVAAEVGQEAIDLGEAPPGVSACRGVDPGEGIRARRWATEDERDWWSCWPWMSTSPAPTSASWAMVAMFPLIRARDRPSAGTTRARHLGPRRRAPRRRTEPR